MRWRLPPAPPAECADRHPSGEARDHDQDLLTHTAGISSRRRARTPREWKAAGLNSFYCADKDEPIGTLVERMGKLPMEGQPGEKFIYGYNTDILGAVVEKVSGMPLDQFFQTRIFEPLKMSDTSFYLPTGKRSRLAAVYSLKDATADGGTGAGSRPRPGRLRGRPAQVLRRRGGAAVDGHRLRAVPADAGERW